MCEFYLCFAVLLNWWFMLKLNSVIAVNSSYLLLKAVFFKIPIEIEFRLKKKKSLAVVHWVGIQKYLVFLQTTSTETMGLIL